MPQSESRSLPETTVRNAVFSADLYQVLMDVQNGIDSPGLNMMANNAIRKIDAARKALETPSETGDIFKTALAEIAAPLHSRTVEQIRGGDELNEVLQEILLAMKKHSAALALVHPHRQEAK